MPDKYKNFADLNRHHKEGIDYNIETRETSSKLAIMAPHGGYIEHATRQIASAIAEKEHNYYCFHALYDHAQDLHLTSNNFDEPRALNMCNSVETVITIHGAYGKEPHIYFGGRDEKLKEHLIQYLTVNHYPAKKDPSPTRQGLGTENICNRGKSSRGVQIELTQGFRKSLFHAPDYNNMQWRENDHFIHFCNTLREALSVYSEYDKNENAKQTTIS